MRMLSACIWLANCCHTMGSDVLRFRSRSWTRSTTLLPGMATPSCINSPLSFHFVVFKRDTNLLPFSCSVLGSVVTTSAITSVVTIGSFSFTTTTGVGLAARSLAMSAAKPGYTDAPSRLRLRHSCPVCLSFRHRDRVVLYRLVSALGCATFPTVVDQPSSARVPVTRIVDSADMRLHCRLIKPLVPSCGQTMRDWL